MTSDRSYQSRRPHPWHGIPVGDDPPEHVNVYIEMTPSDGVKYEIDKKTGYLKIDRPRRLSSQLPTAYGFIPRTYCDERVARLSEAVDTGDRDPLDVCVVCGSPIERSEILLSARVLGGLHMVDKGEADDKIIAVLDNDNVWGEADDIDDLPDSMIQKLRHYFLTYKMIPGEPANSKKVSVDRSYGVDRALEVVSASRKDYEQQFGQ